MKGLDDHITGKDDPNNPANDDDHEHEYDVNCDCLTCTELRTQYRSEELAFESYRDDLAEREAQRIEAMD